MERDGVAVVFQLSTDSVAPARKFVDATRVGCGSV